MSSNVRPSPNAGRALSALLFLAALTTTTLATPVAGFSDQAPSIGAMTAAASGDVARPTGSAIGDFGTPCPEMTDSVYRLYVATYLREPDTGGFDHWVNAYAQDGWHLRRIAQFFTEAPEFQDRYGSLDNAAFVNLVYDNILGRAPEPDGFDYWVGRLNNGLSRGGLLLFFSEGEEFVASTGSYPPLAGYLRSYPSTTTWACGEGSNYLSLDGPRRHVDIYIANVTDTAQTVTVTAASSPSNLIPETVSTSTVNSENYLYAWGIDALGAGQIGQKIGGLQVDAPDGVFVIIVGSDLPMPDDRPGYDLE